MKRDEKVVVLLEKSLGSWESSSYFPKRDVYIKYPECVDKGALHWEVYLPEVKKILFESLHKSKSVGIITLSRYILNMIGEAIEDEIIDKDNVVILIYDNEKFGESYHESYFDSAGILHNFPSNYLS